MNKLNKEPPPNEGFVELTISTNLDTPMAKL